MKEFFKDPRFYYIIALLCILTYVPTDYFRYTRLIDFGWDFVWNLEVYGSRYSKINFPYLFIEFAFITIVFFLYRKKNTIINNQSEAIPKKKIKEVKINNKPNLVKASRNSKDNFNMSPIKEIKICYSKYANFNDRASRSEFWYFTICFYLTVFIIAFFSRLSPALESPISVLVLIFVLVNFLPGLAVTVRRLHDINVSGLWLLLPVPFAFLPAGFKFIPAIINICLLIALMFPGTKNKNKYGDPIK